MVALHTDIKASVLKRIFKRSTSRARVILKLHITAQSGPVRPSFMGIGFGSGILLDLVLFADRIIAEPKSNRSILWDIEVCNDLNGVCAFF